MAPPNLVLKDDVGGTLGTITFVAVSPGVPSAAETFRLLNDDTGGTVDEAIRPSLQPLQIDAADSNQGKLRGLRAVDERWLQIRATGSGSSGSTQPATAFEPWGAGRDFVMNALPEGEYHELEVRYAPPGSADPGQIEFDIGADADSRDLALEKGHYEAGDEGIIFGIGDGLQTYLSIGSTPTEQSPVAAGITLPDLAMVHDGFPGVKLTHDVAINENDGSAAALGSGEAYWAILSLSVNVDVVVVTITKGDKATSPLDEATKPAVPTGELFYASVERGQGDIVDADITFETQTEAWDFTAGSGLDGTVGPGRAMVDNRLISIGVDQAVSFDASETSTIWVLPDGDGAIAITNLASPDRPDPRSIVIWTVVTDGSVVTSFIDRRVAVDHNLARIDLEMVKDDFATGLGSPAADQTSNKDANDHVEFVEISSSLGVTFSTGSGQSLGLITLEKGRSYRLEAHLNALFSGVTGTVTLQWRDNTAGSSVGVPAVLSPKTSSGQDLEFQHGMPVVVIDPAVDTEMELRITSVTALTHIGDHSYCEITASSLITPVDQPSADLISMFHIYLDPKDGYILPSGGVLASFAGASSATQGDLRVEVEIGALDGSSWTSIYTSSGSDDRRARFEDGDNLLATGGMPDKLLVPRGSPIRARLIVAESFDVSPDLFLPGVTLFIFTP